SPTSGVWIMSSMTALALSKMKNPLGQKMYPDLSVLGGAFQGLPAIVSQYAGEQLIVVNAQDVYLADDGQVVIDASREA
ncbi:phage major capsid protein, partial [Proteus mirabilis]|nr:phage major capsid protein [Proteus mirabilis]